jgi:hypothetical protein
LEIRFRKQFSLNNNNNNSTARWMLRIILPKSTTLLVAHYYWDQNSWRFKSNDFFLHTNLLLPTTAISGHRVSFKVVQAKWDCCHWEQSSEGQSFQRSLMGRKSVVVTQALVHSSSKVSLKLKSTTLLSLEFKEKSPSLGAHP